MPESPRNDLGKDMAHYIGVDVGTSSSRACLINEQGDIVSVATKEFRLWHERADYYVLHQFCATKCRNSLRRIFGRLVAMSPKMSFRKRELTLYQSKESSSTQLVHSSSSTKRTNQFLSLAPTSPTPPATESSGATYPPPPPQCQRSTAPGRKPRQLTRQSTLS
jgi:hypothetical protein